MNLKKIAAFAAAAVMAAGICTGVPVGTESVSPLAVTAEAASKDFVIKTDKDGDKYLAEYKGKGGDITIPKEATYIADSVFLGNDKITSVTIPKTCNDAICDYAFSECVNLKKVVIEGDIAIGIGAFNNCINLQSVTVKGSIRYCIGAGAFYGCERLKTVKISKNKYDFFIGDSAFRYCYSLTSINIPSKCTEIYGCAFLNCFSLTKLTIPAKTKVLNSNNGDGRNFGYASIATAVEFGELVENESFVADGKKSGYIRRFITVEESVEKYGAAVMVNGSDLLAKDDAEKITPKKLTLTVTKGSPAEKWAKANKVKYTYAKTTKKTTTSKK